jgi:hypothetical protein
VEGAEHNDAELQGDMLLRAIVQLAGDIDRRTRPTGSG